MAFVVTRDTLRTVDPAVATCISACLECGQACIVVAALPLLRYLGRARGFATVASACVAALGGFWLVSRLIA